MNKSILKSKVELLKVLGIKENYLYKNYSQSYFTEQRPKPDGTFREINKPDRKLKKIQRLVLKEIIRGVDKLDCVYGLNKDKGIKHNALFHIQNSGNELVNMDIEKFYPNVPYKRIKDVFKQIGFSKENSNILAKICTIKGTLPQGSPTSAHLASLFMNKIDKKIFSYCKRNNLIYSRYFDDITISGDKISKKHISYVEKLLNKNGLNLNENKTKIYKCNEDKYVNGIKMNKDGIDVADRYKESIKKTYLDYKLDKTELNKMIFSGKMGFYKYVDKQKSEEYVKNLPD